MALAWRWHGDACYANADTVLTRCRVLHQVHKSKTQTKFKSSSKRDNKDTIKQDNFCL